MRSLLSSVGAGVLALVLGAAPALAASAAPSARPYLVLGDSISAGYQPDRGDDKNRGYVDDVVAGMARAGTPVRATNLACTGETIASMRDGSRCAYPEGSQQAAALAFLRRHPDTALVTVSLGANDLLRCASDMTVDVRCTQDRVRDVRPRLAAILTELRTAAPQARIVVLDYYDPFHAASLLDRRTRAVTTNSTILQTQLNSAVRGAARDSGARVAYVTRRFDDGWARRADLPGRGRVPIKVARVCAWTWACEAADIHPNDAGYTVIADEVLRALQTRS